MDTDTWHEFKKKSSYHFLQSMADCAEALDAHAND